jgi:hypothetical protein
MTYKEYNKQADILWQEYLNRTEPFRNLWRKKILTKIQYQDATIHDLDLYSTAIKSLVFQITSWEV